MVGEVRLLNLVCIIIFTTPFQIVAVGPNVPLDYAVGKRVCVENHFYCGDCYQCEHGMFAFYCFHLTTCTISVYQTSVTFVRD